MTVVVAVKNAREREREREAGLEMVAFETITTTAIYKECHYVYGSYLQTTRRAKKHQPNVVVMLLATDTCIHPEPRQSCSDEPNRFLLAAQSVCVCVCSTWCQILDEMLR